MLLTEAGLLMGFILFMSGANGQEKKICVFKGSPVELPCRANHTSSYKWYTVDMTGTNEVPTGLSAHKSHLTNMTEEGLTLKMNNVSESDAGSYCCSDRPNLCRTNLVQLSVSDLQVKVFPDTDNKTVSLMCSTSCLLTRTSVVYIWYRNGEYLYEDQSPWYQELVSSEEGVRYSCAVKGYEDLRAPEVSVDSVTSTCFTVTYSKGRMCSYQHKSEEEPCSITHPTELRASPLSKSVVGLRCNTTCKLIHNHQTAFRWYHIRSLDRNSEKEVLKPGPSNESFSCAIKGLEHLPSPEVCIDNKTPCWTVNYVRRRICALERSSVNITSQYSRSYQQQSKVNWFKITRRGHDKLRRSPGQVEFHEDKNKTQHVLIIKDLQKDDSAEYKFRLSQHNESLKQSDLSGVVLFVTGLTVITHHDEVREGQRVTLTCSTSCPLPTNTTYIWSFNKKKLQQSIKKHLVLDPVSCQQSGSYSCAVIIDSKTNVTSNQRTLHVVKTWEKTAAAAAGAGATLLFTIPLMVFLWIRTKRTSAQSPLSEASDNTEQLNPSPVYENISTRPAEQDDLYYSTIHFSKSHTDPVYSTVQPHQPESHGHSDYAVVFKPRVSSA